MSVLRKLDEAQSECASTQVTSKATWKNHRLARVISRLVHGLISPLSPPQ